MGFTHCYLTDAGNIHFTSITFTQLFIFTISSWETVALNHFYFQLLLCKANCFAVIIQRRVTKTGSHYLKAHRQISKKKYCPCDKACHFQLYFSHPDEVVCKN